MVDQEQGGRGGAVGNDHVAIVEREFDVEGDAGGLRDAATSYDLQLLLRTAELVG